MQNINRILCVVDPTETAQPALLRAAWLARKTGAELELLICHYNEYLSGERLFDSPSLEKARNEIISGLQARLEEMAEPLRSDGLTVTTTAVWDYPLHEGIVRHSKAVDADLVFKDTHHHSAIARAFLSNTDWHLIRSCNVPLWLVKPQDIKAEPTLIAAIDPLHDHDKPAVLDDEILSIARSLGDVAGGAVHAFHSYDPRVVAATATSGAYLPISLPYGEFEEQMRKQHEKPFNALVERHDFAADHAHLVAGAAHEELPELAKKLSADLVIMGAVSRNRLKRLFVGSTAERTLEHLPCDLLIVKPEWIGAADEISDDRAA